MIGGRVSGADGEWRELCRHCNELRLEPKSWWARIAADPEAVFRVEEGVLLPAFVDDAAEGFDAVGAEALAGCFDGGDLAADVVHARAARVDELLDDALGARGLDDFELQEAAGDGHDGAVVAEPLVGPAAFDFAAEDALLPFDLAFEAGHGHGDVVDALEVDGAAAGVAVEFAG